MNYQPTLPPAGNADAILTDRQTCLLIKKSPAWLRSPAGRAIFGRGFLVGHSRRYRQSVILAALARCEEAAK
jgi:ACR3 family arsenite efflux pump ArsB